MHHRRFSLYVVAALVGCSIATTDPDCMNLEKRHGETLDCCEAGAIIPMKDNADCPSIAGVDHPIEKMMCLAKCSFEAHGLLNGDEINEGKLREYVNRLDDGQWKAEAVDVVSDCLEALEDVNDRMENSQTSMPCHHAARVLSTCLIRKTIELCPYADWRDSSYCYKLRNNHCFKYRNRSTKSQ